MNALAERFKRTREERSLKIIREFLLRCRKPHFSWSGGKDSTLMLWLTLKVNPDILVVYFDADSCLPDGWEYMQKNRQGLEFKFSNSKNKATS